MKECPYSKLSCEDYCKCKDCIIYLDSIKEKEWRKNEQININNGNTKRM